MRNLLSLQLRNAVQASSITSSPVTAALFSSKSSSDLTPPRSTAVPSTGAVAELAGDDDDDDLEYNQNPPITVSKPSLPDILQPRVVVFDGVCRLCHNGVKWVVRADKYEKIKFCCLQSKTAEPYLKLCDVEREDVLRRFIFIEGLGQYHQGSTAALKVLSYLPFPYSALSSLSIIPTPMRDAVYDYVAKRRYDWFGKVEDCLVMQDPEMLKRFIDREEILERHRSEN